MGRENCVNCVRSSCRRLAGLLAASGNRLATTSGLKPGLSRGYLAPLVLLASVYALARLLVAILLLRAQAEAERDLELLALRHEVAILRRHVKRPELLRATACFWQLSAADCPSAACCSHRPPSCAGTGNWSAAAGLNEPGHRRWHGLDRSVRRCLSGK